MELYSLIQKAHQLWLDGHSKYICACLLMAEEDPITHEKTLPVAEFIREQIGHSFSVERWLAYVERGIPPKKTLDWRTAECQQFIRLKSDPDFIDRVHEFRENLWSMIHDKFNPDLAGTQPSPDSISGESHP